MRDDSSSNASSDIAPLPRSNLEGAKTKRAATPGVIELTEYVPQRMGRDTLPESLGEKLWRDYSLQIKVDFPSPRTDGQWQLTAQGWAGYLPVSPHLHLWLRPKVPIRHLFRMWEYAYALPVRWLPGLFGCHSIAEFYESLALVLAHRVLHRAHTGLYSSYLSRSASLPYVRGRLDIPALVSRPADGRLPCRYREATVDLEDNRILLWTLHVILRCGLCSGRVLPIVRQAFRALGEDVALEPCAASDCIGRSYDRLNKDYRELHALCRFFLEGSGPGSERGDDAMLPFLVDMERLFELFIAQWLKEQLPATLKLRAQERVVLNREKNIAFRIDLVLSESQSNQVLAVLDTKYKAASIPSSADIAQVVAYAEAKGCTDAVLVYPSTLAKLSVAQVGTIRVRSISFDLGGDWQQAGAGFLNQLLK